MVTNTIPSEEQVYQILSQVMDPEIPVISIVELGIVRKVEIKNSQVTVTLTPTYSGCPATPVIERDVRQALAKAGLDYKVDIQLAPPWSTDFINESGRTALQRIGISPPEPRSSALKILTDTPGCPLCGSVETELTSQFSSTPCKALYKCKSCLQPFEHFKTI